MNADDVLIRDLRRIYNDRGVTLQHREAARRAIARIGGEEAFEKKDDSSPVVDAAELARRDEDYLRMRGIDVD